MLDAVSKVERYRKEANRCAELAKDASPPFLAEIYRRVAVRYVFMAEELANGPQRDGDAIERADQMISRLGPGPMPDRISADRERKVHIECDRHQVHLGDRGGDPRPKAGA